jgi:3-hydroxyisobutyrate dehydrogenase
MINSDAMANIAFLGTGLLGSGMVENFLRRGETVTVWNRTSAKARALEALGARVAATPEEAVAGASRVHMTLSDDAAVDGLMAQFVPRLGEHAWVVDHTTTAPAGTRARYERSARDGVRFVHAPVFMTPQMCRDGVGMMLVSGPRSGYDALRGELERMTGTVWYLGERTDLAAGYKLFGNSMFFTIAGGVSDVLTMAKALDISPTEAVGLFAKLQVGNMIGPRAEKMSRGDFTATFELTMARKDIRLMIEAAGPHPLAVLPGVAARMDDAIAAGHGHEDLGAIAADAIRRP